MYKKGFLIPRQGEALAERINKIMKKTRTTKLIVVGDLKHKIPVSSEFEKEELHAFLSKLKAKKVILTKGNHDGKIEQILHGYQKLKVVKSFKIKNYLFTHGHRKIETDAKTIVIGHNHPHIKFKDEVGSVYIVPVWVKGFVGKQNLIIMPAFNEMAGSTIITDWLLGPIAKNIRNASAFLLDGTDIGKTKNIE